VVRAGNATATAVGTAFDVNSDDEGITVSVTHGIVDVKSYLNGPSEPHLALRTINAGQLVRADKQGAISYAIPFDIDDVLAWRAGRLVYQGEKLSVITAEINRYRAKKIRLLDKTLRDKRITLSVAADKTEQLIAAIKITENVHIVETPTEILISKATHD
jgi:transmembrane sensor